MSDLLTAPTATSKKKREPKFAALTVEHIAAMLAYLWHMLALDEVREALAEMLAVDAAQVDGREMYATARARIEQDWRARFTKQEAGSRAFNVCHLPYSVPASTYTTLALVHPPMVKRLAKARLSLRTIRTMLATMQQKEWRQVERVTPARTVRKYARKWLHRSTEAEKWLRGLNWQKCAESPRDSVIIVDGKWRQLRNYDEARFLAYVLTQLQRAESKEAGRSTYATMPENTNPLAQFPLTPEDRLIIRGFGSGRGKRSKKATNLTPAPFHAVELADELDVYDGAEARDEFCQRLAPQVYAPCPRGNAGLALVDRQPQTCQPTYIVNRSEAVQATRRAECEALQAKRIKKLQRMLAKKLAAERAGC